MNTEVAAARRKAELGKIHIAKAQLGLAEDDYRALLWGVGKVESAADLDARGRAALLDEFKQIGFKAKRGKHVRTGQPQGTSTGDKAKALWLELHRVGQVKDPSEAGLAAYCFRMTKVSRVEWLNAEQSQRLIECLKKWLARVAT